VENDVAGGGALDARPQLTCVSFAANHAGRAGGYERERALEPIALGEDEHRPSVLRDGGDDRWRVGAQQEVVHEHHVRAVLACAREQLVESARYSDELGAGPEQGLAQPQPHQGLILAAQQLHLDLDFSGLTRTGIAQVH
jgi:hypothetical protein